MAPSRDLPNADPVLDIVVDEIMYRPVEPNAEFEYIELYNPHPTERIYLENETGVWRLDGAVDYLFPAGTYIDPQQRLIVVGFDPAVDTDKLSDFEAKYGAGRLTVGVEIVGDWAGRLASEGERLALKRPQAPDRLGAPVSWVIVDEVIYSYVPPWPVGANGTGDALQRNYADQYHSGNDPANWRADSPTPGDDP
jgi:hypothetical protein